MDVFDRIMAYNAGREPERLHMKLTAMQTNPFTFLRGTCHLFYEDWHTSLTQIKSPSAWICGDCHLENFGTYKGDNGLVYFDLNDFDECALAPCLWDLTRLLTSLILAAKSLKLYASQTDKLLYKLLSRYAQTLAAGKPKWVERKTANGMVKRLLTNLNTRTQKEFLGSRIELRGGVITLTIDGKRALKLNKTDKAEALDLFKTSMQAFNKNDFYYPLDIARRVAGTGSLGIERHIVLIAGDKGRHRLIDMKKTTASAISPYLALKQAKWQNEAYRVATIQSYSQAIPPALLKPTSEPCNAYLIKEMQPTQDRLSLSLWNGNLNRLDNVFATMAEVVAWNHLRNAGYLKADTREELMRFGAEVGLWSTQSIDVAKAAANQTVSQWLEYKKVSTSNLKKSRDLKLE